MTGEMPATAGGGQTLHNVPIIREDKDRKILRGEVVEGELL